MYTIRYGVFMKKLLIVSILSLLVSVPAMAASQTGDKYELGKYNFNFQNAEPVEFSLPVKQTESVSPTEVPVQNQVKKPLSQKEVIEQIKKEEAAAKTDIQNSAKTVEQKVNTDTQKAVQSFDKTKSNVEQNLKKDFEKTEQNVDKIKTNADNSVKNEVNKVEKNIEKSKKLQQKTEKPIKFDKNKPPFQFKIMQMNYDGNSSTTIEKL